MIQKFNVSYSSKIILRMLGDDEKKMEEFHQNYKDACLKLMTRSATPPTKKELKIIEKYRGGKTVRELARENKMSYARMDSLIRRVAKYALIYGVESAGLKKMS